jgi:hypothetical protein
MTALAPDALETSAYQDVHGLPSQLPAGTLAGLGGQGTELLLASGFELTIYRLGRESGRFVAEQTAHLQAPGGITAVAESSLGWVVAVFSQRVTSLFLAGSEGFTELLAIPGRVIALAAAMGDAYAAVTPPQGDPGRLVRVDLRQRAIVAERPLPETNVTLRVNLSGQRLVVAHRASRRVVQLGSDLQPPQTPLATGADPASTLPGGILGRGHPSLNHPVGCCCGCCDCGPRRPSDDGDPAHRPEEPSRPPSSSGGDLDGEQGIPGNNGEVVVGNGGGVDRYPPVGIEERPCGLSLFWAVHDLRQAGRFALATDRSGRNAAVFSPSSMKLLTEWQLGQAAVLWVSDARAPVLLRHQTETGAGTWHLIDLDTIAVEHEFDWLPLPIVAEQSKTFYGMKTLSHTTGHKLTPSGPVRTIVLPVIEGDQIFSSPNIGGFAAFLNRTLLPVLRDYYIENSFGLLKDFPFSVFGAGVGPGGGPLKLPRAKIADYYWPAYDPARVELVKNGVTGASQIVLDGRETLTIAAAPLTNGGPGGTLTVPFFALALERDHNFFPVQIRFLGTERLRVEVHTTTSATHKIRLKFPAKSIDINDIADVPVRLDELATYLESVFLAAEAAAGVASRVFARPQVHRIPQSGLQFGRLLITVVGAATTGSKLTIDALTPAAVGADPIGLSSAIPGTIDVSDTLTLERYLTNALLLAQEAQKFDYSKRLLAPPEANFDAATGRLTTTIAISDRFGGPGATVGTAGAAGLATWFDTATVIPNNATTKNDAQAPRDTDILFNDAFSAAVARLRGAGLPADSLKEFDCVLVLPVEVAAPIPGDLSSVQPGEQWSVTPLHRPFDFRGVDKPFTAVDAADKKIQLQSAWNLVFMTGGKPDNAVICHEVGHAIGYADLYHQDGYRDELAYLNDWAMMSRHTGLPHHCGYHKLQAEWIPTGKGTEQDFGRVFPVFPTKADETRTWDILLVPIELWRDSLIGSSRVAFGVGPETPVAQLIKIDLGGDGGMFDLIEARQPGTPAVPGIHFSRNLPGAPDPGVLVTNCIVWWDDTRYVFNGLYRRPAHLLNPNTILRNAGDRFDLARAPELPVKGIEVEVTDRKVVEGDAQVFRLKVTRRNAEFVDLYFTSADPYYKNPDLWVDWPVNGRESYGTGAPTDQGDVIRVLPSATVPHFLSARVRNRGLVKAVDVKLTFRRSEPPGAGDRGKNYVPIGSVTIPELAGGGEKIESLPWDVPAGYSGHNCLQVVIEDWKIPVDATGSALGSDDVWMVNNHAEKNVDRYEALRVNPYDPVTFDYSVHNAGLTPEVAYLEPYGLGEGMALTVTPSWQRVPAGRTVTFRCKLDIDSRVVDAGCRNDQRFRLITWRQGAESSARWGGVEYEVRPRDKTATTIGGYWDSTNEIELSGTVTPDPGGGRVRIRLDYPHQQATWVETTVGAGGGYSWLGLAPATEFSLTAIAWFEGTPWHGSSRSQPVTIKPPPPLH